MIKSNWFRFLRNCSGVVCGTLGTVFSVSGPTFTKKLLKELAMSRDWSTIFPLIVRCEIENFVDFLTLTML